MMTENDILQFVRNCTKISGGATFRDVRLALPPGMSNYAVWRILLGLCKRGKIRYDQTTRRYVAV